MCGIIGYVGKKNALGVIINGLERLEYRGYDSCGVAFLKNKKIELLKESGKIENLKKQIDSLG
jgi:glucosamine--fructose-6-phosphate aminotransferase (isomerizing)